MAEASETKAAQTAARADRFTAIERSIRLVSGLILFTFVTTHLLNHTVGIFGVDAMEAVQVWRVAFWRSWPGSILLYGAAILHVLFVSKRIVGRRTWRMPLQEAVQIALGLTIPLLLYEHAIGTRFVATYADVKDNYASALLQLWPGKAWWQIALVSVVWVHGIIGIHYTIRAKSWFPKWRETLLVLAVLVPVMAIAGFVSGGREAIEIGDTGANWTNEQRAAFVHAARIANWSLFGFAGLLTLAIAGLAISRRFGNQVAIRYTGHGLIDLPKGSTLLEGSRENAIPHPSLCGGRARCSTCRVLVTSGNETLPPPGPAEAAMLKRISAPPKVRLACQIRPQKPISVQVLLPVDVGEGNVDWGEEAYKWGTERTATVLVVDLRAFAKLSETQLPYDLVVLLNRFISEMRQTIEAHGGRSTQFLSDGLIAVFGLNGERASGSRAAMSASRDMLKVVDALNEELRAALTIPLRIGIGIHTGPVVMARVGDDARGYAVTALGESVTVASRLEQATKTQLSDCLVSQETLKAAGRVLSTGMRREIQISGRPEPVVAFSFDADSAIDKAA